MEKLKNKLKKTEDDVKSLENKVEKENKEWEEQIKNLNIAEKRMTLNE